MKHKKHQHKVLKELNFEPCLRVAYFDNVLSFS